MLRIVVPGEEHYDEKTQEFFTIDDIVLELEHSLVSLSKWESKFEKPFLSAVQKTEEEVLGYIELMILTPDFPPEVLNRFTQANMEAINAYIEAKMTATWFPEDNSRSREIITSELIYYWMISANVPMECENWHLNRLFTLLRVISVKNSKPQKKSAAEIHARNRELNARRRAELGTTG